MGHLLRAEALAQRLLERLQPCGGRGGLRPEERDVVALGDELFDQGVADLAGTEDNVAGHELLSSVVVVRVARKTGRTEVRRAAASAPKAPKVVKLFADFGFEALPGTPQDFYKLSRAESDRWGKIIAAAGVKLD